MATIVTLSNLELYKELSDEELTEKLSSLQTTIENDVDTKIGNLSLPVEIVENLPTASKECLNILYLIPSSTTGNNNIYEEYICIEKDGAYSWEKFGTVSMAEITKSGTKGDNNAVSDISVSGNIITVTYATLATEDDIAAAVSAITAASLGALTSITSSGTKDINDNVVTDVSASGGTVTVTYGQLTAADVGAASSSDLADYVPTERTIAGHALSDDVTLELSDISDYSVASDADIEALFSDTGNDT